MRVRPHPTAEPRKYQTFKKEVYTLLRAKGLSKPRAEAVLSKWTEYVHARWKAGRPPCAVSDHLARWEKEKIVCPCKKAGCKGKSCKASGQVLWSVFGPGMKKVLGIVSARTVAEAEKKALKKYGSGRVARRVDERGIPYKPSRDVPPPGYDYRKPTATFMRHIKAGDVDYPVDQRLFALSKPLRGYRHVIVSASSPNGRPETFIFGASPGGTIQSWEELPGSFIGELNHVKALRRAGYELAYDRARDASRKPRKSQRGKMA